MTIQDDLEADVAPPTEQQMEKTNNALMHIKQDATNPVKSRHQRQMAWSFVYAVMFFTLLGMGIVTFVDLSSTQITALTDIVTYFYLAAMTVISAFMGFETFSFWSKK